MFALGYLGNALVFLIFPLLIEVFFDLSTTQKLLVLFCHEISMFANTQFSYTWSTRSHLIWFIKYIWYCCLLRSSISMCSVKLMLFKHFQQHKLFYSLLTVTYYGLETNNKLKWLTLAPFYIYIKIWLPIMFCFGAASKQLQKMTYLITDISSCALFRPDSLMCWGFIRQ